MDCEARLGGAGARNSGQSVEYSNTERGPVCGVGFGCKKGEGEKGTTNGIKAGTVELKVRKTHATKFLMDRNLLPKSPNLAQTCNGMSLNFAPSSIECSETSPLESLSALRPNLKNAECVELA